MRHFSQIVLRGCQDRDKNINTCLSLKTAKITGTKTKTPRAVHCPCNAGKTSGTKTLTYPKYIKNSVPHALATRLHSVGGALASPPSIRGSACITSAGFLGETLGDWDEKENDAHCLFNQLAENQERDVVAGPTQNSPPSHAGACSSHFYLFTLVRGRVGDQNALLTP